MNTFLITLVLIKDILLCERGLPVRRALDNDSINYILFHISPVICTVIS